MAKRYYASEARERMQDRERKNSYGGTSGKMIMREDSKLIREDMSKRANLPTEVMEKTYNDEYGYMPGVPMDLYTGVNDRMKTQHKELRAIYKPSK